MSTHSNHRQAVNGDLLLKERLRKQLESPPSLTPDPVATAMRAALVLVPHAEEIADRSVLWVCEHDTEYSDLVTTGDLRSSSRLCVEFVLTQVAGLPVDAELERAPESIGERRASQFAPLEAVLRTLRIDYRLVWEAMLDLAARDEDMDLLELLTDGAARMWDVIDKVSVRVAAAYRAVEGELHRCSEEQARILASALIRGTGPLGSVAHQAATHLGLSLNENFVVCCAEALIATGPSSDDVKRALARQGMRSIWHPEAQTDIGIIEVGPRCIETVADVLRALPDLRVGLSPVSQGLAGVRGNVWLAEAALRAVPVGTAEVASLDTHLLGSMAAGAQDLGLLLYQSLLESLSNLRPAERARILATVSAHLEGSGSVAETASQQHYHRNTIINHLRQFEQETGRSLHKPRDVAEISIAFEAWRLRGQ